jgi:hypothetical protein
MAETPGWPSVDPRLRDFLDAELRQAEADFRRPPAPEERRTRGTAPLATLLAAAAVLLLVMAVGPRLLGGTSTGPAAIQLGPDGLPTSIGGEPVLRGAEIAGRAGSASPFLAGGVLRLASDPCPAAAPAPAAPCAESWSLNDPAGSARYGLAGIARAPGFVRTSGALTVLRVAPSAPAAGSPSPSTCAGCGADLSVQAVVWRQPTRGPMPPGASPPQGGPVNDALVPDFVSAWNADQTAIAGYVPKAYLVGPAAELPGSPSSPPQAVPEPVYGDDLATLVGQMVPGVGFVPLGDAAPPASPLASVAPSPIASASPAAAASPAVDCGRVGAAACDRAVALARAGNEAEVASATEVVVDDACAPLPAVCDRLYPFDAIVVFVTAGADTTGWYAFEVTGPEYSTPAKAQPLTYPVPAHIVARLPRHFHQAQRPSGSPGVGVNGSGDVACPGSNPCGP